MKIHTHTLLAIFLFLLGHAATSQVIYGGRVVDIMTGEPLPGVTVLLEQDATRAITGVATDLDGKFTLELPSGEGELRFSYVGYSDKLVTLPRESNTEMEVGLEYDVANLDEVVVTGLATNVKRRNLANAVATLSDRDIAGTTSPQTFDAAISGKVVGATVVANSGSPGGGIAVKMRGVTTFYGNSQPLYVVDGVFMDNSAISPGLTAVTNAQAGNNPIVQDNMSNRIADLNPHDIESIEVLKGATAAAIYGSRAAAGVVVITTKKGTASGGTDIHFSQDFGMAKAQRFLGQRQLTAERVEAAYGAAAVEAFEAAQAEGRLRNYEKEVYGETGFLTNSRLSLSGGNQRTTFYLSGMLQDEEGIVKRTGYVNRSLRASVKHSLNDRIFLTFSSNFINSTADRGLTNNDNSGITYGISLASTPAFADLYPDEVGLYPANPYAASNVLQTRDLVENSERVFRTLNSLNARVQLFESDRSSTRLVLNGASDYYTLRTLSYFPPSLQFQSGGSGTNGASLQGNTTNLNLNFYGALVNITEISDDLQLTSSLGATFESRDLDQLLSISTELIGTQTNVSQAAATSNQQNREAHRNNGFLLQEEFNYRNRIFATLGMRLDRSTLVGETGSYFFYPKAAIAWNVHNMDFWNSRLVRNFKVRAAYGQSGNLPPYFAKYTLLRVANTGGNAGTLIDLTQGDPDIKPERQSEFEVGADLVILDKISLEATYYNKQCTDLLLLANVPQSTGFSTRYLNGGELVNRGIELGARMLVLHKSDVKWETGLSWWKNTSEVTKLETPAFERGAFGSSLGTFFIEEGKSATQIVGFNGETLSDGSPQIALLGDAAPDFQMYWSNELSFLQNFSLRFHLHWKKGGDNINLTELLTDLGGTSADFDGDSDGNGVSDGLDRLNMLGTDARQFVQDASYLRVRDIGLYYTVPDRFIRGFARSFTLGISLNNFITFTKYKGYDPEVSNSGIDGVSTGVDITPFPSSKRAFFHLSLHF